MQQNPMRVRPAGGLLVPSLRYPDSSSVFTRTDAFSADPFDDRALLLEERESHAAVLADRDRLLAVFAHDLKNLMNALTLNGEIRAGRSGARAVPGDISARVLVRMDRLVSNLLDLTRVNAGKLRVILQRSLVSSVVREAVTIFRPLAEQNQIKVKLFLSDENLEASFDHDRIFQVLSNLLTNAVKFTPPGGTISVGATKTGNLIQVAVEDTGSGIEEGDIERVFDCYRQINDSHVEGLGLGLFIARSIIEAHGGRIWVASRPGLGSTFFFTLAAIEASSPG
jgi:signal transduction histidine kinase